jgi:hypothetical protein
MLPSLASYCIRALSYCTMARGMAMQRSISSFLSSWQMSYTASQGHHPAAGRPGALYSPEVRRMVEQSQQRSCMLLCSHTVLLVMACRTLVSCCTSGQGCLLCHNTLLRHIVHGYHCSTAIQRRQVPYACTLSIAWMGSCMPWATSCIQGGKQPQ